MAKSQLEILGAASAVAVCMIVGAPVLFIDEKITLGPEWLWWACYLGFLVLFTVGMVEVVPRRLGYLPFIGLVLAGAATVLLAPGVGWLPILLVFATALSAHLTSLLATMSVLVLNSVVAGVTPLLRDGTVLDATLTALVYTLLQLCAVWAVRSQLREAAAHERIAVANTELRAATALLAESSRSAERLRISRELHDLVGHQLTALVLELEVASHHAAPPADKHVRRSRELARELLRDVRVAVGELRAHTPDLHKALTEIVADLPQPRVHLTIEEALEVDEACTAALIRCVQEVVTNAIRHSSADNLWIDVARADTGEILLTARDDGQGASLLRLGNGLTGVRERIAQLDGEVSFDTRSGFRIEAKVPVP